MKKLLYVIGCSLLGVGCAHTPSAGHVVKLIGKGTKGGITENPVTGSYEIALQRVQMELITIPLAYATNKDGGVYVVIPDVVDRVEALGKNSVFGNAGDTWTLATGSNSVNTLVGGQTTPVNGGQQHLQNIGVAVPTGPTATPATK